MIGSDLQRRLDIVVVGHRDGAGRAVLWRTPGVAKDMDAVRQLTVLPPNRRFVTEPGWMLRKLPSGRWMFLVGGTQHPDLRDAFGRSGIFHGAGWIATPADASVLLGHPDAPGMTLQAARVAVEGVGRTAPSVAQAAQHPPIKVRRLPAADREVPLPAPTWGAVQGALRASGARPFTAPVGGDAGPILVPGQVALVAGGSQAAFGLDGAQESATRILAAWSAGEP